MAHFKKQCNTLVRTIFFSDNCAVQFKSKYCVWNLCHFEEDFGVKGEWNFFSPSHGKGAVDGIGGAIKVTVWRAVKSHQVILNSAKDFYEFASKKSTAITVLWSPSTDVNNVKNILEK